MKMKRVTTLLVTGILALSLMACGGKAETGNAGEGSGESTGSGSEAAEESGESTNSGSEAAEEEKITCDLLVWTPSEDQSPDYGNWIQSQCEAFAKEHPNWEITFSYGVASEAEVAKLIAQDVDAAADVFMMSNDQLTDLLPAKAVARIGGQTEQFVKDNNSETMVESLIVDGALYGVPFTSNTWFMYYDKSVFSEDDIKNLDAMLAKGVVSFPITNSWYLPSFYIGNGCTFFEDGQNAEAGIDFSGDKAVAVTDYLVDLVSNPNFQVDVDGSGIAGIRDGSIHAMFSGSWDYESVKEALGDNFGVAQLPTYTLNGEEKQMYSFAGSKAIGVSSTTEYPQVAVALAQYLGGAESQKSHYESRNIIPCNNELLADPSLAEDMLVQAQNNTVANTSIIQPFIAPMANYWVPSDNFGKSLRNGEVTHDNAAESTEAWNHNMNTSVVE